MSLLYYPPYYFPGLCLIAWYWTSKSKGFDSHVYVLRILTVFLIFTQGEKLCFFFGLFFVYFIFYKVLRYVNYSVNSTGDSYYENNCPANLGAHD